MALRLTITASASSAVTVQDVFPAEGTFCFTLDPAHTKVVDFTDAQYNHLKAKLDAMTAAGLLSYTVEDTEEARSDEMLELQNRTAKVVTLAVTGGAVPNLVTLGIRKGDVFVKYVAVGPVTTSYIVDEVNSALTFTATTTVAPFNLAAAGDKISFTREGVLIATTDRTVGGAITNLIATVSQSTYPRTGFGRFFVKASDGKPYFMTGAGTEMSLGMIGSDPLVFKGTIAVPGDFPTAAAVQNGWLYRVTANVTDSDGTKTNTGMSFPSGSEIAWIGTWCELGDAPELRGKVFHVDGNRADAYIEDGTLRYPYKTIAAAIAVPPVAGDTIVVAYKTASPYAEAVVLPNGVSLEGISGNYTYIDGNITTGTLPCSLKYIVHAGVANVLEINGGTTMRDFFSYGQMSLPAATSKVQMWNCHVNATGKPAILLGNANAEFFGVMGKLSNTGDFRVIDSTAGKIMLDQYEVVAPGAATAAAIFSTAGSLRLFNSSVVAVGGGAAINANNGATTSAPNVLHSVLAAGAVTLGTAVTVVDNVQAAPLGGALTMTGSEVVSPYLQTVESPQGAAASEPLRVFRALRAGKLVAAAAETGTVAAAAESMAFTIQKTPVGGAPVQLLNAAITVDNAIAIDTPVAGVLSAVAGATTFAVGDLIIVTRVYVAGGGATPMKDTVCTLLVQYNS